ncbi:MAG: hypothetical protein FWG80_00130 [Alphaproteobacteria bacterium]|nr:hypothetical protein [Alphaproteobacteria bacterium]
MKFSFRIFALCSVLSIFRADGAVPTNSLTPTIQGGGTNNLTAFTGNVGAMNNNAWNQSIQGDRGGGNSATADFGNCRAVISRCASPRCGNGGCTDFMVAAGIVNGCVQSNASCRQYGDDLVNAMAAELVANSTSRANQQQAQMAQQQAAAAAASDAAAAQQMAQMQQQMATQMQEMQAQMAAQQAESAARVEAALAEQRQQASQPQSAQSGTDNQLAQASDAAANAAALGISADVLVREQASGQILSKLDNVKAALNRARAAMQETFDYAGCNRQGDHCAGVPRVSAFKAKAQAFFEPYDETIDEVYDALIMAQALGVDITDIYMMLNGSCHVWGQYACSSTQVVRYELSETLAEREIVDGSSTTKTKNGLCRCDSIPQGSPGAGMIDINNCTDAYGNKCKPGAVVPMNAGGCQLMQMLTDTYTVQQNFLDSYTGSSSGSRIELACASEALEQNKLFARRKKGSNIDIELLEYMLAVEAPNYQPRSGNPADNFQFCSAKDVEVLRRVVQTKRLNERNICVGQSMLNKGQTLGTVVAAAQPINMIEVDGFCKNSCIQDEESGEYNVITDNSAKLYSALRDNSFHGVTGNISKLLGDGIDTKEDCVKECIKEMEKKLKDDCQSDEHGPKGTWDILHCSCPNNSIHVPDIRGCKCPTNLPVWVGTDGPCVANE